MKSENNKLNSKFGETIDKTLPLSEYPRPQLQRNSYVCLNGQWDYAILKKSEPLKAYQGKILVPYSPESILSGVNKILNPDEYLYYKREFVLADSFKKDITFLHFGAVDYICSVKLNGKIVGTHKGAYIPFFFDISKFLREGVNILEITVSDPTNAGNQTRGKQTLKPHGIWYTPQSGIWQTVWLESVNSCYVEYLKITPDIDTASVSINLATNVQYKKAEVTIYDGKAAIATSKITNGEVKIKLENPKLWDPAQPNLYDMVIRVDDDEIKSYFGMRKFSSGVDKHGVQRLFLNNKPYFHNGLLDQGYWSDSLLTPPSDEAMIYDIEKTKKMGFNMLRKHIKIEPLRWYYHCDKLGMLVWQDMVSGCRKYNFLTIGIMPFLGKHFKDDKLWLFSRRDAAARNEFNIELQDMIYLLYNSVSISVWVPFNEGWGQFESGKAYDSIKTIDKTRLIDHASGWHDQGHGDFKSLHIYFRKVTLPKDKRPIVLSEFGGYSIPIKEHYYNENRIFGYKIMKTLDELQKQYTRLFDEEVISLIDNGLSASVYTQLSDVEDECNGLLTFDRKVQKLSDEFLSETNQKLYKAFDSSIK